jgi:3-deoxy-D-manno-octulosonic-acid transferase
MAYILYDILLHAAFIALTPYFVVRMLSSGRYREGLKERLGFIDAARLKQLGGRRPVWFHAVSVGEVKAALPVVRLLKKRRPGAAVLLSTVTRTGFRTALSEAAGLADSVIYCPLDLSWAIGRAVTRLRPVAFVVVEKEFWPNTFRVMAEGGIPVIIANGTISERSFRRFLRLGFFFRGVFASVGAFSARTAEDMERAISAGVPAERAFCAGNLKFEVSPPEVGPGYLDALKGALAIGGQERVIVAGSTHRGEEDIVIAAFKALKDDLKGRDIRLVLAPRHPERFSEVEASLKKAGLAYSRRSGGPRGRVDVVLLDTVGELIHAYAFAAVAFVGGSLVEGIGGHNLLEPAIYGAPVIYGPHLDAYLGMAMILEGAGGGMRVRDAGELMTALKTLLSDEAARSKAGLGARKAVEANRGAARRTVEAIEQFLDRGAVRS